jgi:signal transduction histidine kinase
VTRAKGETSRIGETAVTAKDSPRVAQAREHSGQRLERQRTMLRPLAAAVIVAVAVGALNGHPALATHGEGLAVGAAVLVYILTLAVAAGGRFLHLGYRREVAVIAAMGASGVAIAALQPRSATGLAGAAAVWMAMARLPLAPGIAIAGATTAGVGLALAVGGTSAGAVLAAVLLCALLGLIAYFLRQAREGQERSEVLLAELQDAREEQTRAAAVAERGRIAGELHDVLAHSLSAAAIQLEGARVLAEREGSGEGVRAAVDQASALVKEGLTSARQAVGALRGEQLPGVEELGTLVEGFRGDTGLEITFTVSGRTRTLPNAVSLALYRGAQEALTNISRYAPGASVAVTLTYGEEHVGLTVEDHVRITTPASPSESSFTKVGGGHGLEGMRERVHRAGGTVSAGPTADGWMVEMEVPCDG